MLGLKVFGSDIFMMVAGQVKSIQLNIVNVAKQSLLGC